MFQSFEEPLLRITLKMANLIPEKMNAVVVHGKSKIKISLIDFL